MDILNTLYDIYKKRNQSKAQKQAKIAAEKEVYERLLESGLLMDVIGELQNLQAQHLAHISLYHGGKLKKLGAEAEQDAELPPPPTPAMVQVQEERPLSTKERQLNLMQKVYGQ